MNALNWMKSLILLTILAVSNIASSAPESLMCSPSHGSRYTLYSGGNYVTTMGSSASCYTVIEIARSTELNGHCYCNRNNEVYCGATYIKSYYRDSEFCYDVASGLSNLVR